MKQIHKAFRKYQSTRGASAPFNKNTIIPNSLSEHLSYENDNHTLYISQARGNIESPTDEVIESNLDNLHLHILKEIQSEVIHAKSETSMQQMEASIMEQLQLETFEDSDPSEDSSEGSEKTSLHIKQNSNDSELDDLSGMTAETQLEIEEFDERRELYTILSRSNFLSENQRHELLEFLKTQSQLNTIVLKFANDDLVNVVCHAIKDSQCRIRKISIETDPDIGHHFLTRYGFTVKSLAHLIDALSVNSKLQYLVMEAQQLSKEQIYAFTRMLEQSNRHLREFHVNSKDINEKMIRKNIRAKFDKDQLNIDLRRYSEPDINTLKSPSSNHAHRSNLEMANHLFGQGTNTARRLSNAGLGPNIIDGDANAPRRNSNTPRQINQVLRRFSK